MAHRDRKQWVGAASVLSWNCGSKSTMGGPGPCSETSCIPATGPKSSRPLDGLAS